MQLEALRQDVAERALQIVACSWGLGTALFTLYTKIYIKKYPGIRFLFNNVKCKNNDSVTASKCKTILIYCSRAAC